MNKEEIYDSEIAPLMTQIIDICQKNGIAMLASFALPVPPDDEDLYCTTTLPDETGNNPEPLRIATRMIMAPVRSFAFTVQKPDGS